MIKTGMILDHPFPPDPRISNEARTLARNGYEVHLFYPVFDQDKYQGAPVEPGYLQLHPVSCSPWLYRLSALAYTVPLYTRLMKRKIIRFIEKTGVQMLHVHDMVIAEAAMEANRSYRLPLILDLHENRPQIMKLYRHVNRFPGNLLIDTDRWEEKQSELALRADRVIVVTEEAADQLHSDSGMPKKAIHAVPNFIDPKPFSDTGPGGEVHGKFQGSYNMLYIGDTARRRGTDTAIEAAALLKEQAPDLRLIIVGRGSDDAELKGLAHSLQVADRVIFEGWQDPDRFNDYLQCAEIGICPLRRNLHHDTTYANKLFQYMAGGCVLLVSDCTAQARVVREAECGLVHRAGDAGDMAEKILKLYRDAELRDRMKQNGLKAVQHTYNWDRSAESLLKVYREAGPDTEG